MATEINKILLEVEVSSKGVVKNLNDLNKQLSQVGLEARKSKKALDGMGGAAGIAGATAAEFGRLISDLPYGIQAVTNNISQLGSMFSLLVSSSDGVDGAFKNLKRVMAGPAGTLILFQSAVAVVEMLSQSFRKNQAEAKKEADELKNLNEALEKQETLLLSSARTAALYSKDVAAALGDNVKEVTAFLSEVRKEGPITQEVFQGAIDAGRKLLEARKQQNLVEKDIIKTQERLNELGGEGANVDDIRTVAIAKYDLANTKLMSIFKPKLTIEEAMNKVMNERKQVLGDLNLLSLKQGEANEKESEALKLLNYQSNEEIVLTGKVKKEKEDLNETRERSISTIIREGLRAVSSYRKSYIQRRVAQEAEVRDDESFLEWKATFFENLSNKEAFSFEERTAYYRQYVIATQQLGDLQLRNEQIKLNAMEQINLSYANSLGSIFKIISDLGGESRFLQAVALIGESAAGIAKIVISTRAANTAARLKYALLPPVIGKPLIASEVAANNFAAKVGIAANIASTAKAVSALKAPVSTPSSQSFGSAEPTGGGPIAPAFNVIGAAGQNQLAAAIAGTQQEPMRAYVVAGDVTTAQSLERNIVTEASI